MFKKIFILKLFTYEVSYILSWKKICTIAERLKYLNQHFLVEGFLLKIYKTASINFHYLSKVSITTCTSSKLTLLKDTDNIKYLKRLSGNSLN